MELIIDQLALKQHHLGTDLALILSNLYARNNYLEVRFSLSLLVSSGAVPQLGRHVLIYILVASGNHYSGNLFTHGRLLQCNNTAGIRHIIAKALCLRGNLEIVVSQVNQKNYFSWHT